MHSIVFRFAQTGPILKVTFYQSGKFSGVTPAMITSREYQQFARECAKWAVETETDEDRKSFLALAKGWTFAAMATDRATERQETIK